MCSRKWLIVALVACALASACSDYNTNLSIQTSSSILTFVSPSTATVGGQGFTITANGSGFTTGALILWNGTALNTTLVSSIQLTAPVPASDLTTAGTVQVAVQIPGSAQSGYAKHLQHHDDRNFEHCPLHDRCGAGDAAGDCVSLPGLDAILQQHEWFYPDGKRRDRHNFHERFDGELEWIAARDYRYEFHSALGSNLAF